MLLLLLFITTEETAVRSRGGVGENKLQFAKQPVRGKPVCVLYVHFGEEIGKRALVIANKPHLVLIKRNGAQRINRFDETCRKNLKKQALPKQYIDRKWQGNVTFLNQVVSAALVPLMMV